MKIEFQEYDFVPILGQKSLSHNLNYYNYKEMKTVLEFDNLAIALYSQEIIPF